MADPEREGRPGEQSDREGTNAPDPGTMPEEYLDDGPGNRFGSTPEPESESEPDEETREDNLNQGA